MKSYDVVIAGGGISGLYCAMKLLEKPDLLVDRAIKSIIILEKSNRWGGRLDTDIITTGKEDVIKEEEGAMRFTYHPDPDSKIKSNMPLLSHLIKDLKMEDQVRPFYMVPQRNQEVSDRSKALNCNARYFDGVHFTDWYSAQNPTMWKNLFHLQGNEEFKSAGEIVKDIYHKLLEHNKSKLLFHFPRTAEVILAQSPNENKLLQEYENTEYWAFFRNEFTWNVGMQEIPLNQFSMQALLTAMGYSHGCCMMMVQTQGFLCVSLSKGNVGCILQDLITFNLIQDSLFQFEKGWSSLVTTLKTHLEETSLNVGVTLEFQRRCEVVKICDDEKGLTLLTESSSDRNQMDKLEMSAKHVVMALPPKAVETIFNRSQCWKEKIKKICQPVEGIRCTKINLYFDDDWWNQDCNTVMYGPNITSLPCGFVYPFYGECKTVACSGCDKCDEDPCPAALTIYCDVNNSQFWSSLQRLGHKFQSPLQTKNKKLLPASEAVVKEALKQFKKVFNIEEIPHPTLTSYRSWNGQDKAKTNYEDPKPCEYGYAIHMWGLGVDDHTIRKKVAQPIQGKNLYLCNEAWSGFQGWVEGSLMSTLNAVDKILNPEDPDLFFGSCSFE